MNDTPTPPTPPLPHAGHTLAEARIMLARALQAAGIATAHLDARLLLQRATGLSHAALIAAEPRRRLATDEARRLADMARRRLAGEPVSRIFGQRAFFGRTFAITPSVLDPRPETELLVETALRLRPHLAALHPGPPLLADIGTGSGCIIVSLLAEWPAARGLAVDISAAALAVARRNAIRHGVARRLLLLRASWLQAIGGPLDMLLSNPPYLTAADMHALPHEVRHDPPLALAGGSDGLHAYRQLARRAATVVRPGGWLLLEVGQGQAESVLHLFAASGFAPAAALPAILPDIAGIPRVVAMQRIPARKN